MDAVVLMSVTSGSVSMCMYRYKQKCDYGQGHTGTNPYRETKNVPSSAGIYILGYPTGYSQHNTPK